MGVEGDIAASNANGSQACPNGFFFTCTNERVSPLATVTGRLGYAWNRAMFYALVGQERHHQ
jgi:hypothetical protein